METTDETIFDRVLSVNELPEGCELRRLHDRIMQKTDEGAEVNHRFNTFERERRELEAWCASADADSDPTGERLGAAQARIILLQRSIAKLAPERRLADENFEIAQRRFNEAYERYRAVITTELPNAIRGAKEHGHMRSSDDRRIAAEERVRRLQREVRELIGAPE